MQIKQHGETKQHKLKAELCKKTSTLDRFFGSSGSFSVSAPFANTCDDDDKITASELALTYHTVKHNLSYNSMDCTVKLNKIIYVDSKTALNTQLGRTKMEALVNEVLGPYALQTLLNDLNAPDLYFCLQTDASNRKNIKLFPLVVQYFDIENGIQNKLLDFYENCDESANGMFDAINKSLSQHNLSFDRVSGLSADNTNANFGIHHSLYKNIEHVVPNLVKGNCHAHIVHNTVKHAMNFFRIDVENIILKIYSHFSVSAVRREELKKFVAAVEGEWHELKRHVGTRWLSLLPCVDNILLNWKPLSDYFISLGEECPTHIQNSLMMNETDGDSKVQIFLNFASHFLHNFHKAVKQLEGNNITVLDVYNIMSTLKSALEQRKKDCFFGYETKKMLQSLEAKSPTESDKIKKNFLVFVDKCLEYLNKWFDFNESNWLCKIQKLNLKHEVSFDDCETILEVLNLQEKMSIKMDELYSEITILNEIFAKVKDCSEFTDRTTGQKWQHIFKNTENNLPNLFKIISFLLSIPATSAFTERIFSIMNSKWREERNRASISLIKNELLIYINLKIECDKAYDTFIVDKKLLKDARSAKKYSFYKNK